MSVKAFKLGAGFDVVTEVKDGSWVHPMTVTAVPTKDGKAQVTLTPLLFFAEGDSMIPNTDHIFGEYTPNKNVTDLYTQTANAFRMKKSGIVAPSSADISRATQGASRV